MWKRCRRRPRHIADTTTTLFPLTNTVWNQPDTLFPHPPRSVRTQKQRSLHHSVWSNARNAVSYLFLLGFMLSSRHKSLAHFSVAINDTVSCFKPTRIATMSAVFCHFNGNIALNFMFFSLHEAHKPLKIHIF